MIMLNPNHPRLVRLGLSGKRSVPKTRAVTQAIGGNLWQVYLWAINRHVPTDLSLWTSEHAQDFLEYVLSRRAPSTVHADVGAFRMLYEYKDVLTDGGITSPPWPVDQSNAAIAKYRVGQELKTQPMSPHEWGTVVNAAWKYINDFQADIQEASRRLLVPFSDGKTKPAEVRKLVGEWLLDEERRIPLYVNASGGAATGDVNFQQVLIEATGHRRLQPKTTLGAEIVAELEKRVAKGQTAGPQPVKHLEIQNSGKELEWRPPIETVHQLHTEQSYLRTAAYLLISALTLMRDSEIQGIQRNSIVNHYGSPAIRSEVWKRRETQVEGYWWAADPVLKAVEVMEAQDQGPWLFGIIRNGSAQRRTEPPRMAPTYNIKKFVQHINKHHHKWNLEPIETAVNARKLRRTMAVIAGSGMNGPIAVALQLKHATRYAIANQLSSAYAAPDSNWMRTFRAAERRATVSFFRDLAGEVHTDRHLGLTGPGAQRATEIAQQLAEPGFRGIVDDGTIERTLSEIGIGALKEGPISYCLGDPKLALCLSQEEKARGDLPNPIKCQPHRCSNSFVPAEKQKRLRQELAELTQQLSCSASQNTISVLSQRITEIERLLSEGRKHEQRIRKNT